MFEVGFTEIVLILGLALLVLGPEKLPGLAEKIGRWTGRARSMARQLRMQLEQEVTLEEMTKSRPMQSGGPAKQPEATPADSSAEQRTGPQEPWAQGTDTAHTAEAHPAEVHPAEVHPAEVHPAEPHPEAAPAGTHDNERPVEVAADRATTKAGQ